MGGRLWVQQGGVEKGRGGAAGPKPTPCPREPVRRGEAGGGAEGRASEAQSQAEAQGGDGDTRPARGLVCKKASSRVPGTPPPHGLGPGQTPRSEEPPPGLPSHRRWGRGSCRLKSGGPSVGLHEAYQLSPNPEHYPKTIFPSLASEGHRVVAEQAESVQGRAL